MYCILHFKLILIIAIEINNIPAAYSVSVVRVTLLYSVP